MYTHAFPTFRCIVATLLLCLPATEGWARGDSAASVTARSTPVPVVAPALADQIEMLLSARFMAASNAPSTDARRDALEDLSHFTAMTVEGLIEASPSGEMRELMDARLRPILVRHQENIGAALAVLAAPGERPAAQNAAAPSAYGRVSLRGLPRVADGP